MPFVFDDDNKKGSSGSFVFEDEAKPAKKSERSALEAVKSGLSTAGDYALGVVSGAGAGVAATEAGLGTFIQAPVENLRSGLTGAAALADRGITAVGNWWEPGSTQENQALQETAQDQAAKAAAARDANVRGTGPTDTSVARTVARAGRDMQDDGRSRSASIRQFDIEHNPELVRQQQALSDAEGFVDTAKALVNNPLAFTHTLAQSAPDMALGGAIAGKVAQLAGGSVKAASVAGIGTEAASSAYQAREGVYQQVIGMPVDKLAAESPRFKELLAQGQDPIKAREALANELADQAPVLTGMGTAAGSMLVNKLFKGDKSAEILAGQKVTAKDVGRNFVQEGIEEVLQGAPEDLVQHGAMVQADPSHKLDMAGSAVQNFAAGGVMGGGGSAGAYTAQRFKDWRAGKGPDEPGPAVPPAADGGAPVNAAEILGRVTPPESANPANALTNKAQAATESIATNDTAEAEKALREPVELTALDRVSLLDGRIKTMQAAMEGADEAKTVRLTQDLAPLQAERDRLTKDWPQVVPGHATQFSTESGVRLEGQYALMDVADLVTSHDENLRQSDAYPQELQPRDRTRAASEMQVSGIVQRLDPHRLGVSADAATGAPIVGADGLVESGNARSIALKRVYQANGQKAEDYRQFLRDNAAQFGITPESVDSMAKPVLVRVRSTPVNRAEFARQANAAPIAQMSPSEQAKADAARIDTLEDLAPDDNGDFSGPASRGFVRRFMAKLPATEQASMIDGSGSLSTSGYARVRNAVLAAAYGDSPVLPRLVESLDDNQRNISKALMIAAPQVAQMRKAVADGARFDADITPDLLAAVEELARLKDDGVSVQDALAQAGMFGDKYSAETRELMQFLADNARRPRKIADFIGAYMDALDTAGDPNQGSLLGDVQAPAKSDLLSTAQRSVNNGNDAQNTQRGDTGEGAQARGQAGSQPQDAQGGSRGDQGAGTSRSAAGRQEVAERSEWVDFPKDSGTIGIPRAEMPQIKGDHRGALLQFLQARGIDNTKKSIQAKDLKPTQAEFSTKKAAKWGEVREGVDRSVLVSSDGHILDGHHQYVAALAANEPVQAIVLGAPIRELLTNVFQFPSVRTSDGATSPEAQASSKARQDFKDAMADLADLLADKMGTRVAMVPPNTPGLHETLVKLFVAAIDVVGTDLKRATKWVKEQLKANADTKQWWNKVSDAAYQRAALEAMEQGAKAHVDDLFAAAEKRQADLFADEPAAPATAMIDGRAYDMKRDNFKPPAVSDFVAGELVASAKALIDRFFVGEGELEFQASAEEKAQAQAALDPKMAQAQADKAGFDQVIIDVAKAHGLGQIIAPIKSMNSAVRKVINEYQGNASKIADLLRATVVVAHYSDASSVIRALAQKFEIVKIKNKEAADLSDIGANLLDKNTNQRRATFGGYADVSVIVETANGTRAEIQINIPAMLAVKDAEGHRLYEAARVQSNGSNEKAELNSVMKQIYDVAFATDNLRDSDTQLRKTASSEAWHLETGSPRMGASSTASSSSRNQRPSGNLTNSSPPNDERNSQPAGNLSGTGTRAESDMADSSKPIVSPAQAQEQPKKDDLDALRKEALRIVRTGAYAKEGVSVGEGGVVLFNGTQVATLAGAKTRANVGKAIEAAMATQGAGDVLDGEQALWGRISDGVVTPEEFKAGFTAWMDNKAAILEAMGKRKKEDLLALGGAWFTTRHKSDTKSEIAQALWLDGLGNYALSRSVSYTLGQGSYEKAVRAIVDGVDAERLAQYAKERKEAMAEHQAARAARAAALENPQTLDDFRNLMRQHVSGGKTSKEAFLMLTPEQRVRFDELAAEATKEAREARKRTAKTEVRAAGQATGGEIIATKHTRDGYDLFVVKLADRVSKEDYSTLLGSAKRMGGWYSAFRGNGAVAGFQFKDKAQAEAFLKLAAGDTTDAKAQAAQRRDSFQDDRSQTAVERLTEMADRLDEQAAQVLGVERKANTERRARFAAAAEAGAHSDKALATTMRNIAQAIGDGKAKFLDAVRQKTQVELLASMVRTAKDAELRAKYVTYGEQEKHKGEKPTDETADFADFPAYTAFRSDLASLARQMLEVDGTKKLGQGLMKIADDVSEAFTAFAKENAHKLMRYTTKEGGVAAFSTEGKAQAAIERSGFRGKAIPFMVKRGQWSIITSPSEAINLGLWKGDGDKRITLARESGAALVEAVGRRANQQNRLSVPWQFENAYARLKALGRMGIETPAEFRSALREFIRLQEQPAAPDTVKALERAMVGRRKDGLDFFPTPQSVADEMVQAAGIEPGMSVLEPSAGMGHIAERIREAGVEPDVVEMSGDRRELLEAKGFNVVGSDFLTTQEQYDRIVMNPPFSEGRDIAHVQHAYGLLEPGGRLVAIMGESAFTSQSKRAGEFRAWLEALGGTEEKLPDGSFMDPSLPVNTGANARMVVLDKPQVATALSRTERPTDGMNYEALQGLKKRIKASMPNMPEVVVLPDPNGAPKALRDYIEKQGAWHDVEGAMHNGKLYLFASGLSDELRAEHVLAEHEAAHFGLRAVLGKSLPQVMQAIFNNNATVRQAARRLQARGVLSDAEATEEVIVDIPTSELVQLKGWRKLTLAARDWFAANGFTRIAGKLSQWLAGSLTEQQRSDLFVANLVREARAYVRGKATGKTVDAMGVTRLSTTLSEDIERQEKWLTAEAKARGYEDIEDLLASNYPLFERLAELWRKKNPAHDGVMLSRANIAHAATNSVAKTASERADDLIAKSAATARPVDLAFKTATKLVGLDRLTGALYDKAAFFLNKVPENIKAGIVSDYGVPEAVLDQRTVMQGRQRQALRKAGTLLEKLSTLTRAESRVAYEWMNMDGSDPHAYMSMMAGLPEESVKVLQEVQKLIDDLSQEAMRLGQLSPEAYKAHRFAYLRRSYIKHTAELTKGEAKNRGRVISVLGDQYKGRGLSDAIPMAKVQNIAPEWWKRKLVAGKADASLKGEKFIRMERRAPSGQNTMPLPGMTGKQQGKLLEVQYWPAGEKLPARYADWAQVGTWEVRDTKGGNLVMWRDFTPEERETMGEIDEARFAIAKTLHNMIHDVEVGKYLEWLGQTQAKKEGEAIPGVVVDASESYLRSFAPGEWVRVPESKITGTNVYKYGKLAGQYIPGPVWNDLRQVVSGQFKPFGDTYAAILSAWKSSKTALSPAVHLNNIMSNFVMADWHDVSAGHIAKALRIILAGSKGSDRAGLGGKVLRGASHGGIADSEAATEVLNRYKDSGGDIGGWVTQEIRDEQLKPLLDALEKELAATNGTSQSAQIGAMAALQHAMRLRFPSAWEAFKPTKAGTVIRTEANNLIDLYGSEDDVFRLAAWLKAKEEGKTDLEAGKVSRQSFLDYRINAPWIQTMRATAWPFVSFTYRAVPMFLEAAAKKPHKLLKLMALAGGINALGVMLGGGGDDDERKLLPEEKAGKIWGMVPKLIRMPWNDGNGSPVYLDIRRFIPVGDVFDLGQGHAALPVPPSLMPGGPMAILGELYLNKSSFTGQDLTQETDTTAQKYAKVADYLWKTYMPNLIGVPNTYATQGVVDAAKGKTDAFGREQSVAQALASSVGVKLGSYPKDVLQKNIMAVLAVQTMEIDRNISKLKRQRKLNAISQEEYEESVRVEQEKKRDLREKAMEKLR